MVYDDCLSLYTYTLFTRLLLFTIFPIQIVMITFILLQYTTMSHRSETVVQLYTTIIAVPRNVIEEKQIQ